MYIKSDFAFITGLLIIIAIKIFQNHNTQVLHPLLITTNENVFMDTILFCTMLVERIINYNYLYIALCKYYSTMRLNITRNSHMPT